MSLCVFTPLNGRMGFVIDSNTPLGLAMRGSRVNVLSKKKDADFVRGLVAGGAPDAGRLLEMLEADERVSVAFAKEGE